MKFKLLVIAGVLIIFFGVGFRFAHPQGGLASAMGSAKSSVAVYKSDDRYVAGQRVIVVIEGSGNQLGIVKSATEKTVDVDTGASFIRINQEDVVGKLVGVIPFFGTLFDLVGL